MTAIQYSPRQDWLLLFTDHRHENALKKDRRQCCQEDQNIKPFCFFCSLSLVLSWWLLLFSCLHLSWASGPLHCWADSSPLITGGKVHLLSSGRLQPQVMHHPPAKPTGGEGGRGVCLCLSTSCHLVTTMVIWRGWVGPLHREMGTVPPLHAGTWGGDRWGLQESWDSTHLEQASQSPQKFTQKLKDMMLRILRGLTGTLDPKSELCGNAGFLYPGNSPHLRPRPRVSSILEQIAVFSVSKHFDLAP